MKNNFNRYTVTAALPYTNGPVHIGHLAGVYIPADIYVRYLRSKGKEVIFICGSDEHGVPITLKAKKEGVTPQEVVDKYHRIIGDSFRDFGISFNIYHRTSSKTHHQTAAGFFTALYEKGIFTEEVTEQYFDEKANQFLADRYITGTCPNCGNENAYGDQCEKCGTSLSPTELINPKSTLSGDKPVLRPTKNWFLPLDKMQPEIEKYIDSHKEWRPTVYGQCKSWLNVGLQPRAMTRDLDWGVHVPLEDAEGKVLYVWFDAPIGYISATKDLFDPELNQQQKKDFYLNEDLKPQGTWKDYWQSEDSKLVHFIGKDNIVFHCIIFPAVLMAHGSFKVADNVPANEFLNLEGDKISTSRNWAVWLPEYLKDFPDKQDVLRYVLTATAPETKDNDFTWKDFQARNNNELVAILGNFINRVMVLSHKYFDGKVEMGSPLTQTDIEALAAMSLFPEKVGSSIEQYRFREALAEFMNLARLGNKYLADEEPWQIIKSDEERVKTILNVGLQISANLAILMQPFLPFTAKKLFAMLNMELMDWNRAGISDLLGNGHQLNKAILLFDKIEDLEIEVQVKKLMDIKLNNEQENILISEAKPDINFDQFAAMDVRVGTILSAEKVAKTKKLLKLTIDTGLDKRIVVSGIAEYFDPQLIVGKQVSIIINLEPREIKGIMSQGMILMAENPDGKLSFVSPLDKVSNGSVVR
ncbi:MAG: methionine--tRNA ligase [Flavobacterium sp.]|nr:methionine--tRNA ligase [Pedobacter sp.]